jgi:hypothetical protein
MVLRILLAVCIVVFARFVLGLVRALGRQASTGGRPEVRRPKRDEDPRRSGRVIDVDYTEHRGETRKGR